MFRYFFVVMASGCAVLTLAPVLNCLLPASLHANESFYDDFIEPDLTNPDRQPVTWTSTNVGDEMVIEDESLLIGKSSGGGTNAVVVDFAARNVAIEAQFRLQCSYGIVPPLRCLPPADL